MSVSRTLADLKPGESGVVSTVGGEDALHRHLLDMGITPGVKVLLQKTAPMGDPVEIHLPLPCVWRTRAKLAWPKAFYIHNGKERSLHALYLCFGRKSEQRQNHPL